MELQRESNSITIVNTATVFNPITYVVNEVYLCLVFVVVDSGSGALL